jgi:branched-chain amino acid transport system ATP-binding protein
VLEVRNIDVSYGDVQVLFDVSFDVGVGEIVSLLGANGAGKTTTLRAISGLSRVSRGTIAYESQPIHEQQAEHIVRAGISHVPEGRKLFSSLTVMENLEMGSFLPRARAQRRENMARVFDLFPRLSERAAQDAGSLSGGEQQMLAIGRALMSAPKMLILDEPSLALAPIMVQLMFETVQRINAEGISILLVEQNASEALEISHRAYVLQNGRVVLAGRGSELRTSQKMRDAYLGLYEAVPAKAS